MNAQTHAHINTFTHTHTHAHAHTSTHIHTHTHTVVYHYQGNGTEEKAFKKRKVFSKCIRGYFTSMCIGWFRRGC